METIKKAAMYLILGFMIFMICQSLKDWVLRDQEIKAQFGKFIVLDGDTTMITGISYGTSSYTLGNGKVIDEGLAKKLIIKK